MGLMAIMSNKFLRSGYEKAVADQKVPPQGTGAKERIRQETFCTMLFAGETDVDAQENTHSSYLTMSTGPGGMGDPYGCTAAVSVEAAECLLHAIDHGNERSLRVGFGTPAYPLAHLDVLDRLVA